MLIYITMKNPDCVSAAIDEAVRLNFEEREDQTVDESSFKEEIEQAISKFVTYGEYITVIIDTTTGTATVYEVH